MSARAFILATVFVLSLCLPPLAHAVLPPSIDQIYPPEGSQDVALNSEIWLYGVGIGNIPIFNEELAGPALIAQDGSDVVPTEMLGSRLKHYPAEDLKKNRVGIIGGATPYTLLRLKPVRELKPNTQYQVELQSILGEAPEEEHPNTPEILKAKKSLSLSFRTGSTRDQSEPQWHFEYSPRPYRGGQEGYDQSEAQNREYLLIHTAAPQDPDSQFTRVEYNYANQSGGFQVFSQDMQDQDVVLRGQGCVVGTAYDLAGNASAHSDCREASQFWKITYWLRIQSSLILLASLLMLPLGAWLWQRHKKSLQSKTPPSQEG